MKDKDDETEIIAGDIRIDLINRLAYVNGMKVFIPDKPFAILVFLARNQNRPVTKEEILQQVWGYSSSEGIQTNTVEVNIRRLRMAIGERFVRTARGEGYYLQTTEAN